ncbi:MAG: serine/threonine protein kinase [Streptosporangiaceae bacterium]|nr:serine/threonine protein kinase [Streptosporangiaceae bacterium]
MGQQTMLAGRYQLMSPLGRGGMGQVWEGEDRRLGRRVAVKLLTNEVLTGRAEREDLARRFAREAAVTAGLQHPGVPAVYDAGTYDGGLFLVMELVGGCTLGDLMAEQGPLPVAWAAGIAAQMAAVLAAAHERRFVHRDVKPQNVMLTGDGTVKVLDFGVAAVLDQAGIPRLTRTGEAIGTLAYMAPEQLQSRPATPRTDLYALGCVLYEMLAGEPIFDSTSPAGLMHKHLQQVPSPLRRGDLPPELDSLVRQLLEKDPGRRPVDARETYDRLLPHVARPGPLSDIDPAGDPQGGMHLYSRVLVRLSGAAESQPDMGATRTADTGRSRPDRPDWSGPQPNAGSYGRRGQRQGGGGGPYGQGDPDSKVQRMGAHEPGRQPTLPRSGGWKLAHSVWILPTLLFGMGTWLSFGYIAARHRRLAWMLASIAYLLLAVTAFALVGSSPETGNGPETVQSTIGMVIALVLWPAGFLHALWVNTTVRLRLRDQESLNRWDVAPPVPGSAPFARSHPF